MKLIRIILLLLVTYTFTSQKSLGQSILVTGRVIGEKMEYLDYTDIANLATKEKTKTNDIGIYDVHASVGDTLLYHAIGYTDEKRIVKDIRHLNVLLIHKQINELGAIWTKRQYSLAEKERDKYYKSLEKKAEKSGKWNY